MSLDAENQQSIGYLRASFEHLDTRVQSMEKKLDQVVAIASTAKGGWNMLIAVGSFGAAVGAVLASVIEWWKHT